MGIRSSLTDKGLRARAMRGTTFTVVRLVGENALRLAANLILTRLLFPEAFGLMALVQTVVQGLKMLSDTGVLQSIVRSERGDDPDFLNTAWSVQVCRGLMLWLITCGIAYPLSLLYDEPMLALLLPVAGFSVFILGFRTTKVGTARRHLVFGRLTLIQLSTQFGGLLVMLLLAWWWNSVWALAVGGVVSTIMTVVAQHIWLPGIRNRFLWNKDAFLEIFNFGKYIFLSSVLGFLINYGDKLILGAYLTMSDFGVYNIGYMLATLPFLVGKAISNSVLFPLYRARPIAESPENRSKVLKARRLVTSGGLLLTIGLSFVGVPLIELMYDPRYELAGPVVVLMCFALVPLIVVESYSYVFLAAGDSRSQFIIVLIGAILQIGLAFTGIYFFGTLGVIIAPAISSLLLAPIRIRLLRPHQGWDPLADMVLYIFGFGLTALACWIYWDDIVLLMP